jgi:hypothetical protein
LTLIWNHYPTYRMLMKRSDSNLESQESSACKQLWGSEKAGMTTDRVLVHQQWAAHSSVTMTDICTIPEQEQQVLNIWHHSPTALLCLFLHKPGRHGHGCYKPKPHNFWKTIVARYLYVQNSKLGIYRLNELIMNHDFTMQRILVEISRKIWAPDCYDFSNLGAQILFTIKIGGKTSLGPSYFVL